MKMILNLIQSDAGRVQLLGERFYRSAAEIFKRLALSLRTHTFTIKMTARQNLGFHCEEYMGPNEERIDEVFTFGWTCRMSRENKSVITR